MELRHFARLRCDKQFSSSSDIKSNKIFILNFRGTIPFGAEHYVVSVDLKPSPSFISQRWTSHVNPFTHWLEILLNISMFKNTVLIWLLTLILLHLTPFFTINCDIDFIKTRPQFSGWSKLISCSLLNLLALKSLKNTKYSILMQRHSSSTQLEGFHKRRLRFWQHSCTATYSLALQSAYICSHLLPSLAFHQGKRKSQTSISQRKLCFVLCFFVLFHKDEAKISRKVLGVALFMLTYIWASQFS